MTPARCPVMDRACSTAYGKGCRCGACRSWNAEHSRRGRKPTRTHTWSKETIITRRHRELWVEADAALRSDPGYVVAIAEMIQETVDTTHDE